MVETKSEGSHVNGKAKRILFKSMELIMQNLKENIEHLDANFKYTQKFINTIQDGLINNRRFFLLASGRSAFILQCFATRLVHLGAETYIITNLASLPALRKKDILIVLSGSGTTSIVVSLLKNYVNTVKPYAIISITSHPETMIGRVGDITIKLKGRTKRDACSPSDDSAVLTPEGTQFEQIAFTYLDAIIAELAIKMGKTNEEMLREHSEST
ncbi:MAG: 3-hexulose-6-phosphate isomerase [Promethearchaeota archaeon]|nr:MAG: 3-hexulose-6-phosphate isomerase [Candidatus Lokiarchaeota archaeon]